MTFEMHLEEVKLPWQYMFQDTLKPQVQASAASHTVQQHIRLPRAAYLQIARSSQVKHPCWEEGNTGEPASMRQSLLGRPAGFGLGAGSNCSALTSHSHWYILHLETTRSK